MTNEKVLEIANLHSGDFWDKVKLEIEAPKVEDILDFGQGDDDDVFDIFEGIHHLMKGYYQLFNWGDKWWEVLNQDIWCDHLIEHEMSKIDWDEFGEVIEKVFKVMCGSYIREDRFYKALKKLDEQGVGFRPDRKKKDEQISDGD